MQTHARESRSQLFTVRVWPEEVDNGRIEWRGKVQRVENGETLYFHDWGSMVLFLQSDSPGPAVGVAPQQKDGRDEQGLETQQ